MHTGISLSVIRYIPWRQNESGHLPWILIIVYQPPSESAIIVGYCLEDTLSPEKAFFIHLGGGNVCCDSSVTIVGILLTVIRLPDDILISYFHLMGEHFYILHSENVKRITIETSKTTNNIIISN